MPEGMRVMMGMASLRDDDVDPLSAWRLKRLDGGRGEWERPGGFALALAPDTIGNETRQIRERLGPGFPFFLNAHRSS